MSARSTKRRRRPAPPPAVRRRPHDHPVRRQPRIVTECVGWGLFAAVIVPAALILTGGSVRTAVIAGAGTAGLTAVLYLIAKITKIALPHLDGLAPTPMPLVDEPLPQHHRAGPVGPHAGSPANAFDPPIPRTRAYGNERGVPQSPPYGYESAPSPPSPPYGYQPAPPLSRPYGYERTPVAPPQSPPYGSEPPPPLHAPPGGYRQAQHSSSPAMQRDPLDLDADWDLEGDPFDRPPSGSRRGPRHRAP